MRTWKEYTRRNLENRRSIFRNVWKYKLITTGKREIWQAPDGEKIILVLEARKGE